MHHSQPLPTSQTALHAQRYHEAEQLIAQGDIDSACGILLALVQADCSDWQPYNDLGVIALQHNDTATALHFLEQAAQREALIGTAHANLLAVLEQNNRLDEATRVWARALASKQLGDSTSSLQAFLLRHVGDTTIGASFVHSLRQACQAQAVQSVQVVPPAAPCFMPIARFSSLPRTRQLFAEETLSPPRARYHFSHAVPAAANRFPAINQYSIENALVRPLSEVLQAQGKIHIPDFVELSHHLLYDSVMGEVIPLPGEHSAAVREHKATHKLARGVLLNTYGVINWAHFLTDVLPLVALTELAGVDQDIPLLLSPQILPQMLQLVERLKAPQRPVVMLDGPTLVAQATLFTPVSTVVYDYLEAQRGVAPRFRANDTLFSAAALRLCAQRLREGAAPRSGAGEKIFIDRESSVRRIRNKAALIALFASHGFRILRPESMSADEQAAVFANASVVAGPAGAGLANMIFAAPGCQVIAIAPATGYGAYNYFSNLAGSLGHQLDAFGFAPLPGHYHSPAHPDFDADIEVLSAHLASRFPAA